MSIATETWFRGNRSLFCSIKDRTSLLSDNGSGYVSQAFGDYLRLVGIKHILASPFHPQTNGKVERYQQTLKGEVNQVPYEMPSELRQAIESFAEYYNHRRYHEAPANVTPADASFSRRDDILTRASTFTSSIFPMIANKVSSVGTA